MQIRHSLVIYKAPRGSCAVLRTVLSRVPSPTTPVTRTLHIMHLYAEPWETRLQIDVQRSQLVLNFKSQAPKARTRHQNPTRNAFIDVQRSQLVLNFKSQATMQLHIMHLYADPWETRHYRITLCIVLARPVPNSVPYSPYPYRTPCRTELFNTVRRTVLALPVPYTVLH